MVIYFFCFCFHACFLPNTHRQIPSPLHNLCAHMHLSSCTHCTRTMHGDSFTLSWYRCGNFMVARCGSEASGTSRQGEMAALGNFKTDRECFNDYKTAPSVGETTVILNSQCYFDENGLFSCLKELTTGLRQCIKLYKLRARFNGHNLLVLGCAGPHA